MAQVLRALVIEDDKSWQQIISEILFDCGLEVDIAWDNGEVTDFHVRSDEPRDVSVRVNGEPRRVQSQGVPRAVSPSAAVN